MNRRNRTAESLNNQGFSLIEVLVSVVILAILTLPILSSFASAAKVNEKARKQENANAVAQKMMEEFKSLSVTQLTDGQVITSNPQVNNPATGVAGYEIEKGIQTSNPDRQKIYHFTMAGFDTQAGNRPKTYQKNNQVYPYYEGDNHEKFLVKVTLDPTDYADKPADYQGKTDIISNNINSYDMPVFSDIHTDQNFAIMQEIYQHDYGILNDFKQKYGIDQISYSDIRRDAKVQVEVKKTGTTTGFKSTDSRIKQEINLYSQSIRLEISYVIQTSQNSADINKSITYEYEPDTFGIQEQIVEQAELMNQLNKTTYHGFKNIYLFYNSFDLYRSHENLARDYIFVNYSYPTEEIKTNDLNVYLVEQDVRNQAGQQIKLDKNHIIVNVGKDHATNQVALQTSGTLHLDGMDNHQGAVNIYSNIKDWEKFQNNTNEDKNSLTSSAKSANSEQARYLYRIKVEIWEGNEEGSPFLTMTSTKEN